MSDALQAVVIIGSFSLLLGAALYWSGRAFLRWSRRRAAARPVDKRGFIRGLLLYFVLSLLSIGLVQLCLSMELPPGPLRVLRGVTAILLSLAPLLLMIDLGVRLEALRPGRGRQDGDPH